MSATRTRSSLLFCPATLKKYLAGFSQQPKTLKEIEKLRDRLKATDDNIAHQRVLYRYIVKYPKHSSANRSFYKLLKRLQWAVFAKKPERAIATLDYLLAAPGEKTIERKTWAGAKDPLACCREELECQHEMLADLPIFGLHKDDSIYFAVNVEPERGNIVNVSYEIKGNIKKEMVRFLEWEWDEILAVDEDSDLVHIRPLTIAVLTKINDTVLKRGAV